MKAEEIAIKFNNLNTLAKDKGWEAYLYSNIDGREWSTLAYEKLEAFKTTFQVGLNTLAELEHILNNNLKPKFKVGQQVEKELSYITAGKYKKWTAGKITKCNYSIEKGFYYYVYFTKNKDPYTKMLSPDEGWCDEGQLR